jgi:hypothetical protein
MDLLAGRQQFRGRRLQVGAIVGLTLLQGPNGRRHIGPEPLGVE